MGACEEEDQDKFSDIVSRRGGGGYVTCETVEGCVHYYVQGSNRGITALLITWELKLNNLWLNWTTVKSTLIEGFWKWVACTRFGVLVQTIDSAHFQKPCLENRV